MTNTQASGLHRDPADQNAAVPPIHDGMEGELVVNEASTDGQSVAIDPYEAFNRDVPEAMRYDVMTMLAEAAQGDNHADVHILDRDRIDAINVRAHGIVTINGEEYSFQLEDGNWNGTVLLDWEGGREFVHHVPTRWALQPDYALVNDAIANERGPFLLLKWDAMLNNHPAIAAIPGEYSYDRMMQPGGFIKKHYRDAAAKHRFMIVDQEQADETRAQLAKAIHNQHPWGWEDHPPRQRDDIWTPDFFSPLCVNCLKSEKAAA